MIKDLFALMELIQNHFNKMNCKKCLQEKPLMDFYNKRIVCKECCKKEMISYNKTYRERITINQWKKRGIRYPDFSELYNIYKKVKECYYYLIIGLHLIILLNKKGDV